MSKIVIQRKNPHKLYAGETIYALYKVYPKGSKWFIGYFRNPYDYEAEVRWLDKHEPEPEPISYIAEETGDYGIKDICDSLTFIKKCDELAKENYDRHQRLDKEYDEYLADLARRGIKETDLPLSQRRFPRLFNISVSLADCYYFLTEFNTVRPKWAAEKELLEKRYNVARTGVIHV